MAATLDYKTFLSDTKLRSVFSLFDTDGNNSITAEDLHAAFQKLGQDVPKKEVELLIKKHDLKHDGKLEFDEFKAIFLQAGDVELGN